MKKITLLDLFSGIGGFHLGFQKAGYEVKSYFSEIDKYAIAVYKNNFKNSNYVGTVENVRGEELPGIDGITFGSPCQDFSLAGRRKGMSGKRSALILEAIRIIKECRPTFFVWENVKGTFSSNNREDFAAILQAFANIGGYRLEWQLLNTKWFLPQNRERVYLVGYTPTRSRGQVFPIGKKYKKTDAIHQPEPPTNKKVIVTGGLQKNAAQMTDMSPALTSAMGMGGGHTPIIKIGSARTRTYKNEPQKLEIRKDGNSNTLTSVEKDNYVIGYTRDKTGKARNYHKKKLANTLHASTGGGGNTDQYITHNCLTEAIGRQGSSSEYLNSLGKINESTGLIRRLTPVECERLQGFPDDWTKYGVEGLISDTQRYKMCGNAATVDVVKAVAEKLKFLI